VLNGPGDDLTAKVMGTPASFDLSVQPSVIAATTRTPFGVTFTPSGLTGRVDLTHVHIQTGQVGTAYFGGAQATTILTATGAEPAVVRLQSVLPPPAAGLATKDGDTYLQLDVKQPTPEVVGSVTRGTCDATSPFKGQLEALGGAAHTGAVRFMVGDKNKVPPVNAGENKLDARCQDGGASVAIQMPSVSQTYWDTSQCASTYRFDESHTLGSRTVQTPKGVYRTQAALKNQDQGYYQTTFTNGNGMSHEGSDTLTTLHEEASFAPCMEFRDAPVEWIKLDGTDVAPDLFIDINKKPNPDGDILDTIQVESPSSQATGRLDVDSHLTSRSFDHFHDAQILFRSPFQHIGFYTGTGSTELHRPDQSKDGFQFVLDGDLRYDMQFTDLQSLSGWAKHGCGKDTYYDVEYHHDDSRPRRIMSDRLDMQDCDLNLLTFDALPNDIQYTVNWPDLRDTTLKVISSGDPIHKLDWYSKVQCIDRNVPASCLSMPGPLFMLMKLSDVPAESGEPDNPGLLIHMEPGIASAILEVNPLEGRIRSMDVGVTFGAQSDYYFSVGASNVKLRFEWDLDGDTRMQGVPAFFFGDTFEQTVPVTLRIHAGRFGYGLGGALHFNDFQFRVDMSNPIAGFVPRFKFTGNGCGFTTQEFFMFGRWWAGYPKPKLCV
jgi:hypothetical protein